MRSLAKRGYRKSFILELEKRFSKRDFVFTFKDTGVLNLCD